LSHGDLSLGIVRAVLLLGAGLRIHADLLVPLFHGDLPLGIVPFCYSALDSVSTLIFLFLCSTAISPRERRLLDLLFVTSTSFHQRSPLGSGGCWSASVRHHLLFPSAISPRERQLLELLFVPPPLSISDLPAKRRTLKR
jgi:hypothetical protein